LKEGCDTSIVDFETLNKRKSVDWKFGIGNLLDLFNSLIFIIWISQFIVLISFQLWIRLANLERFKPSSLTSFSVGSTLKSYNATVPLRADQVFGAVVGD